jgi:hypothetical protein
VSADDRERAWLILLSTQNRHLERLRDELAIATKALVSLAAESRFQSQARTLATWGIFLCLFVMMVRGC